MPAARTKLSVKVAVLVTVVVLITVFAVWLTLTSSSCSRQVSRWEAEYGRGIGREVTLYSATGEEIGHWEGTIDVEYLEERIDLLFFDENGNVVDRVVITPGSGSLVIDQI